MENEYICDDRGVWENLQRIRTMTDAEFEAYLEELSKKQNESTSSGRDSSSNT